MVAAEPPPYEAVCLASWRARINDTFPSHSGTELRPIAVRIKSSKHYIHWTIASMVVRLSHGIQAKKRLLVGLEYSSESRATIQYHKRIAKNLCTRGMIDKLDKKMRNDSSYYLQLTAEFQTGFFQAVPTHSNVPSQVFPPKSLKVLQRSLINRQASPHVRNQFFLPLTSFLKNYYRGTGQSAGGVHDVCILLVPDDRLLVKWHDVVDAVYELHHVWGYWEKLFRCRGLWIE